MLRIEVETLGSPGPNKCSKDLSSIKGANFHAFCRPTSALVGDELPTSRSGPITPLEIQFVPLDTEPRNALIILPLMRILQRNLKQTYLIV